MKGIVLPAVTTALLLIGQAALADSPRRAAGSDGLGCGFTVSKQALPQVRCAAIKRQCGAKFYANYCGDKLLSAG